MTAPLTVSRSRLFLGDADRDFAYLADGLGRMLPAWTANGQPYSPTVACSAWNDAYDHQFHGRYIAPAPGPVALAVGPGLSVPLTVLPKVANRSRLNVPVGTTAANVQSWVNSGITDFDFAPGRHDWDRMVTFPRPQTRLSLYGATLRRLAVRNVGEPDNFPLVGVAGTDLSVYGGDFLHVPECRGGMVFAGTASGLVAADGRYRGNAFGQGMTDVYVRDNHFEGGGVGPAPAGFYLRNLFDGPMRPGMDAFQVWGGVPVVCVDNWFRGTNRGLVGNGPLTGLVTVNQRYEGIIGAVNAHEINLDESGATTACAFVRDKAVGCFSNVYQFDQGADGVTIIGYQQEGGAGIIFNGQDAFTRWDGVQVPTAVIRNVKVSRFEIRNSGGIWCGPNTDNIRFEDGSVIACSPTRGNQDFPNYSPALLSRTAAVQNDGPQTNTIARVAIMDTHGATLVPAGFAAEAVP
jgi:hypothetical protein